MLSVDESRSLIEREAKKAKRRRPEDTLVSWMVKRAKEYDFLACHFRQARTVDGWVTAIVGHKGFPDLVVLGPGPRPRLLIVEAKSEVGSLSPEQKVWLARWRLVPGAEVYVLRPRHKLAWLDILLNGPRPDLMAA